MSFVLPPLSVLATWPAPNYENPPTRKNMLLATEIPLIVVTSIVVGLRIISRACLTVARVELDDWLMLFANISAVALVIVNIIAVQYGWGRHMWDAKLEWLAPAQKTVLANEILFCCTVGFTKISIMVFYLRVFSAYNTFRWLVVAGFCYVSAWMICCLFAAILQCWPVHAFWDITVQNAHCYNMYAGVMAFSVLNSISDLYLYAIPIRWVWRLTLPLKQRIGLIVAFGLGLIACVISIVRIKYLKLAMHDSHDFTWNGALVYVLNAIEADLGIICASLPALRPLFVRMFPSSKIDHPRKPSAGKGSKEIKELSMVQRMFSRNVNHGGDSGIADVTITDADTEASRARDEEEAGGIAILAVNGEKEMSCKVKPVSMSRVKDGSVSWLTLS